MRRAACRCLQASLLLLLLLPGVVQAAAQQSPLSAIREGHWLEVRGEYREDGRFLAARVDIVHSQRYQVLIGTVTAAGKKGSFTLLGRSVEVNDKTTFGKLDRNDLVGRRVKVEGYYLGGKRFSARKVAPRGAGRERLLGRADRVRADNGGLQVGLMNFTVSIPAGLEVGHEEDLARYELSESRTQPVATTSRSEDDLFGKGIRVSENLLLAGLLEAKWTGENNFDLNDRQARDRQDSAGNARLRLIYRPSESFIGVAEIRYRGLWRDDERQGSFYTDDAALGETFAYWIDPLKWNLDLQLGRIDFDEKREWLYDQNLDGLRLFHFSRLFVTEFSVTTTLANGSERDQNALNTMLYLSNGDDRRHLAAYIIHRDFDLAQQEKRTHYGIRAHGKWLPNSRAWLELSRMNGEIGGFGTTGWGLDIGNTYRFENGFNFTLGYAWGQGDDRLTQRDESFRQTGLQDNNDKYAGVTSFKYYGELTDPELTNLGIVTAGLGFRSRRRISVDLVWHRYRQDEAARRWTDSSIRKRPNGVDRDLGWEADIILGWRTSPSWDVEIVGGWFRPGKAFEEADDAFLAKLQYRFRF